MFGSEQRTESRLVRRAQSGDPDAFGQLADRYAGLAHAIALTRASNRTDAEDIVQDALLKAYESIGTLRDPAKFGPWLLTIVRNRCRDMQAKHARRADLQTKVVPFERSEQPIEQREMHALLRTKIGKLDEMHGEVLLLHYFAEKSVKEMARLLEVSPDTIKKRLQRAREALGTEMLKELEPLAPAVGRPVAKIVAAVAIIAAVAMGGLWGLHRSQSSIPPLARPIPPETQETPTTPPEVEVTPEEPEAPVTPPVIAKLPEEPEAPVTPPVVEVTPEEREAPVAPPVIAKLPEEPKMPTATVEKTPEEPKTPAPKVDETPKEPEAPVEAPPVETVVVPVPEAPPVVEAPPIEEPKRPRRTRMAMAPLKIRLPEKSYMGTPLDYWSENLELTFKAREPFMAPEGTTNVAKGKPVTSSDKSPTAGKLSQITDGDKEFKERSVVELGKGLQWVQIDLQEKYKVYAVVIWHYHQSERVYFDVVGKYADDVDFTKNVKTFFNSDYDNSAGLGVGKQKEYIENNEGKLIDMKGIETQHIRLYSNGNTANDFNHYIEVEVYGEPVGEESPARQSHSKAAPESEDAETWLQPGAALTGTSPTTPESAGEAPAEAKMTPLKIKLPEKSYMGTPSEYWSENLELKFKPRKPFLAPEGTTNIAKGKPVTNSCGAPIAGKLAQITDGIKEYQEENVVEIGKGTQWVQVDLGRKYSVHAAVLWHYHRKERVYFDLVGECADDADFTKNVRIFYNNDADNSSGKGVGKDKEYIEDNEGRLFDLKGVETRYVRFYSKGNTANDFNHYIEIEVYGKPAE